MSKKKKHAHKNHNNNHNTVQKLAEQKQENKNIVLVKNAEGDPDTTAEIVIQNKIDYEPKVSVIIPVYNVEEYLRECLDSVVNQTLKEIEIICVDDGSTDSSLEILKEYAQKDNRITVMKQANLYAGVARNAGLAVAKGEYLSFLDSDDFFELNMLEEMYKNCKKNKIDVCICDVQFYDNATKKTIFPEWTLRKHFIPQKNVFNCFDIAENIFHITNNWPWNKMFSKHFIKQLNLYFQNTSHTNDTYFVCVALINGKNMTVMKDKFVHYRTNVKNSLTSSFSRNKAPDNIDRVLSAIYKKIKNNKIFYRSFVNLCCEHLTWNLRNITDKESSEILKSKIIENNFYDIPSDLSSDYFYSDKIYNEYLSILDILPGKVIERNLIISQLENFEYISFDIFDTILLRPFSNPFDLFSYIGETINDNNFAKLRMESERTARRENSEEEITLSDIYSYLPEKYQKLMEFEKQLELKFVLINPHISDILSYAKELGKKIIFISDMYLDKNTISKMLQKFNLEKYPLFLSSEIKKTKKTGTLFKYVLSNLKINCNQLLHIGDNIESDILMPQKLGINVCQIKKYIDMYKSPFQIDFKSKSYSLDASVVNALIKLNLHSRNNSYWFNIGYNLGGPLAHSYVNFVDNQVEADELEELLFIARDGFVLKEIYPIVAKNICKTHYIFASRGLIQNINNNPSLDTEYETYLKSKKINGTKLGLIDTTTINFSAQKFLQGYLLNKKLKGLYWLANKNSDANIEYKYIFSRPHKIEALNFLVETLITAPHPPVNKIFNNEPVYEDMSDLEKNRCSIYEKIAAGIIQFNKDMVNIFKKTIEIKPDTVFILLSDWIKNYTQEDYDNFLKLSHSGNISNTNNKPLSIYLDRFPRNKVSVIISVYNVEEYLRECLDSVVNQTLKEIEIICVNDGSTDNSLKILEEYAKKDNRIKIIDQKNQGLACSRNNAIKKAIGKYLVFVDADDYITNDALDKIYRTMEQQQLDMLSYGGYNFDNNTKERCVNQYWEFKYLPTDFYIHKFNYNDCKKFIHQMAVSSCLTSYKKSFILDKNISFPPNLCYEDNVFFIKSIFNATRCGIIKDKLYLRRMHSQQITQNWEKHFSDFIKIVDLVLSWLKKRNTDIEILENYKKSYMEAVIWHYTRFSYNGKKKYIKEIKKLFNKYDQIDFVFGSKQSKLEAYYKFPYYLLKLPKMRKKVEKLQVKAVLKSLTPMRVDIKNNGIETNGVAITSNNVKMHKPAWFKNAQGQGAVVETNEMKSTIKIKAINDGNLTFDFRGSDKRCNNLRFPVFVDYKSIKINNKELLNTPVETWHDKPFRHSISVKNGQEVTLFVEQTYHKYSLDKLKDVVLKLHPTNDFVKKNILTLAQTVLNRMQNSNACKKEKKQDLKHFLFHKKKTNTCIKFYLCNIRVWKKQVNIHKFLVEQLEFFSNRQASQIANINSKMQTQKNELIAQVNQLKNENADLKAKIDALSSTIGAVADEFNTQFANQSVYAKKHTSEILTQNKKTQQLVINSKNKILQFVDDEMLDLTFMNQDLLEKVTDNLKKLNDFKNVNQRNYQELNYADLLHDSIINCEWLKNKSFSLYGWAANYSFIYLLFRTLDKVCPTNILEMGLGQTTKLTSQYIAYKNNNARLNVCEHNKDWIDIYSAELPKSDHIKINHFDLEFFDYEGKQNDKYANILEFVQNQKFDLIIVDGPVGGGKNMPRSNILDLIQNNNLADDFVIIFDDAERMGEKTTIAKAKELLTQKGVKFTVFGRNGIKNQLVITSQSRSFLQFL